MNTDPEKMLKKHQELTHSDEKKVLSHVQRSQGAWIVNTLMIEDCDIPFKYKRKKPYKDLKGQCVNLTYYPKIETVAGMDFDIMNVVRIRVS